LRLEIRPQERHDQLQRKGGCEMGKSLVWLGLVIAVTPASTFAQPAGTRDGTNDVRSQSIGVPGQLTNPVDQYVQRRALQDLSGDKATAAQKYAGKLGPARPAKVDELIAGAAVNDKTGVAIAKIEQVDPDGVVVSSGMSKVKVPTDAFGHNRAGLLLDMSKSQFDQIVASASVTH
jgi:hypothetical protein